VTLTLDRSSIKIEVSTAFLFPENRRHETDGRTDSRTAYNT